MLPQAHAREHSLEVMIPFVRTLQEVCAESGQPEPDLISESGRALTAHHAVLIANVVDSETIDHRPLEPAEPDAPAVLHELATLLVEVRERGPLESLFEARTLLAEAHGLYAEGKLSLPQRAWAERAHYAAARAVIRRSVPQSSIRTMQSCATSTRRRVR